MKHTLQIKLLLLLTVVVLASSCAGGGNQPQITQAALYLDPEGNQPTTSFSWKIPFYLIVELSSFEEDTVVQASWIAMDTNNLAPETVMHIEEKTPETETVLFDLTNEGNFWPIGDYQVNIYLNGKLVQELEYEVYHTTDVY